MSADATPGLTRALLEGWAGYWAGLGFGEWRGSEGAFEDGEEVCSIMPGPLVATTSTAIALQRIGEQHLPGRIIIITARAGVRLERDLNAASDRIDALVDSLHEKRQLALGAVRFSLIQHASTAYLGQTGDGRPEYALTFRFRGGDASRQPGLQPPASAGG